MPALMSNRHWALMVLFVSFALPQIASAADPVQQCVGNHVEGQVLSQQSRLVAARARLVECSLPTCPRLVRDECAALARDVEALLPSVILGALDARGRPSSEPMVSIDGSPERVPLDGRPVALDPGEHHVLFRQSDGAMREVTLVIAAAEHERRVIADFRPTADRSSQLRERRWSNVMWVSGGVAALALGSFTYFALAGRAIQAELRRCQPNCDDATRLERLGAYELSANISLGVALVSFGVGGYAWFRRAATSVPAHSQTTNQLRVSLRPVATHRHVGLWATGEF